MRASPPVLGLLLLLAASLSCFLFASPSTGEAWEQLACSTVRKTALFAVFWLVGCLVTAQWWLRAGSATPQAVVPPAKALRVPLWSTVIAGLVLVATLVRLPLASKGMTADELWNVRHTVVGELNSDGHFTAASFHRALWYNPEHRNHPPASLLARGAHLLWQQVTSATPGAFSELVLRLPSLVCSILGVVILANTLRRWGNPLAGLLAGLLFAVHPWLIRHGVEMRGQALLQLTGPCLLLALGDILRGDMRARWWSLLGASIALSLWAQPGSWWYCVAAGVAIAWQAREGLGRFFVVAGTAVAFSATVGLPALAPPGLETLTNAVFHRTVALVFLGVPTSPERFVWNFITVLLLMGAAYWGLRNAFISLRAGARSVFACLVGYLSLTALLHWEFQSAWLLPLTPVLLALVAWGISTLPSMARSLGLLTLAAFFICTFPQLQTQLERPLAGWSHVARELKRESQAVAVFTLGPDAAALRSYFPTATEWPTDDLDGLVALLKSTKAARPNTPLRLVMCDPQQLAASLPKLTAWLQKMKYPAAVEITGADGRTYVAYEAYKI
jgi:hypothetical protein